MIHYVDNHILVAEKPAGIATQPDFVEEVKVWVKKQYNKPGNVFLEPIHRLDKPVSGLVLFARTSKALSRLQKQMRERDIFKTYTARVEGRLEKEGELIHHLIHGHYRAVVDPKGKEARLSYTILLHEDETTTIEIQLLTGRYHQIRAQFAAIGHPVCGDTKYGSQTRKGAISLKATRLKFVHPVNKELFEITCE